VASRQATQGASFDAGRMMDKSVDLVSIESRLSIVIPAFNEEKGIAPTLSELTARLSDAEIVVIDDGSSDQTAAVVAKFPQVTLVQHHFNRGYGAALKTGMTISTREFVAWFDADNEHRVDDLIAMAKRMTSEKVAAVIAQRRYSGPSPLRNWGKVVIRLLARSIAFQGGKDINCGLRIFRRDVITRYLPLLPNSFSASITSTIVLLERGYPVAHHSVELNQRVGTSKVKISDGFLALMLVFRIVMLFAPMRIFLRFGLILFAVGLVYGMGMALIAGRGLPIAALGLMLGGVLMAFFGLAADQISQMRLTSYDQPVYKVLQDRRIKSEAPKVMAGTETRDPLDRA
jgi:glycosyltransferase involved in cell wall biosynthesis